MNSCAVDWGPLLSSSRTSVRVKLGLFNAKICNENRCFIHRLTYQVNEQDLLCHSAQNVSLILVTSLLDGGLKWVYFVIITVKNQGQWLCFGCVRRITLTVTRSNVTCFVLCSRKVSALWTLQLFCYSPKSGSQVLVQRTIIQIPLVYLLPSIMSLHALHQYRLGKDSALRFFQLIIIFSSCYRTQ